MYQRVALRALRARQLHSRTHDSVSPRLPGFSRLSRLDRVRWATNQATEDGPTEEVTGVKDLQFPEVSLNPFKHEPANVLDDIDIRKELLDSLVAQHKNDSLPPVVTGWPTPWLSEAEFRNYLVPLYYSGWGIYFVKLKSSQVTKCGYPPMLEHIPPPLGPDGLPPTDVAAQLLKTYLFRDFKSAVEFLNDAAKVMRKEKHHAGMFIGNRGQHEVTIFSYTHSARRPFLPQLPYEILDAPGITARDARLAVLFDHLYEINYQPNGRGLPGRLPLRELKFRPAWHDYSWRLRHALRCHLEAQDWTPSKELSYSVEGNNAVDEPAKESPTLHDNSAPSPMNSGVPSPQRKHRKSSTSACPACGESHHISYCQRRHLIPPPRPCSLCDGDHWRIDCKRKKKWRPATPLFGRCQEPYTCSFCGENHHDSDCALNRAPTGPCPNCGGHHRKDDCREPQAPPERLEELKLPIPTPVT